MLKRSAQVIVAEIVLYNILERSNGTRQTRAVPIFAHHTFLTMRELSTKSKYLFIIHPHGPLNAVWSSPVLKYLQSMGIETHTIVHKSILKIPFMRVIGKWMRFRPGEKESYAEEGSALCYPTPMEAAYYDQQGIAILDNIPFIIQKAQQVGNFTHIVPIYCFGVPEMFGSEKHNIVQAGVSRLVSGFGGIPLSKSQFKHTIQTVFGVPIAIEPNDLTSHLVSKYENSLRLLYRVHRPAHYPPDIVTPEDEMVKRRYRYSVSKQVISLLPM